MGASGTQPTVQAYIYFSGTYECSASVDTSGDLNGCCTIPSLTPAAYAITLQQDNGAVNVANGNFTIT